MGRHHLAVISGWLALWALAGVSLAVYSDLALVIIWGLWMVSGLACVVMARGHRMRASLIVALSGVVAFRSFGALLVALSCTTGQECGI